MSLVEKIRQINRTEALVFAGAALSGILMALVFAPFDKSGAAWFALVPLLISCAYVKPAFVWRVGLVTGTLFWLITIAWLTKVTYFGWVLLCLYNGLYVIPVSMVGAWWFRRYGVGSFLRNLAFMAVISAVWMGSEYARFTFFTGFPWNPFGACLHTNIAFIQHASWGGVYVLSGMLVWMNAGIAVTILRYMKGAAKLGRSAHPELLLGMIIIPVAFTTGAKLSHGVDVSYREVRLALIQPAIPQYDKWTVEKEESIYVRLEELTAEAVLSTKPDLVVWPETALPYDVRINEVCYALVDSLARMGSPILVGSMDSESLADRKPRYYNSSFLFDTNGVIVEEYDKRHLVLMGEYVPFHEYVDIVNAFTPVMESFSPGSTSTVFQLPGKEIPFSALICFEDTLPYLARHSVRNGARFLINQTNDAWFDPSWASRQHLALATIRAVENRVPMVRSANTGYSCHIDAFGRIRELLTGVDGSHDGPGFQLVSVMVPPDEMPLTFYTRHGDVVAWISLFVTVVILIPAFRSNRLLVKTA